MRPRDFAAARRAVRELHETPSRWGPAARAFGTAGLGRRDTGRASGHTADPPGFDTRFTHRNWLQYVRRGHEGSTKIGPLALADVRRVLGRRAAALGRCGSPGASTVHFTISGAGRVRELEIDAAEPDLRAATCIARRLRATWFPRGLGSLRVVYPVPPPTLTTFPQQP